MTNANVERAAQSNAALKSKFVVIYYLLTIVASAIILFIHGRFAFAADVFAVACYLAVTVLLYELSHRQGSEPTAEKSRKEKKWMPHVSPHLRDMGIRAAEEKRHDVQTRTDFTS